VSRPLLLLLIGLAACSGCRSTSTGGVVPWLNRPLPLYVLPEPVLIPYPTAAPPCHAGQLRVSQGRGGVGAGNHLDELVFTNIGARACLLRGYPTISAETASGSRRTLRPQRGGTYFGRLVPSDLPPGGHVFLDVATSAGCDAGRKPTIHYRHLVVTLPGGESVRANQVTIHEDCGLSMSAFGLPERYPPTRGAAPGSAGTLRARVHLPDDFRAGNVLRYTVTLSNPTETKVTLDPCPGYSEGLYASGLVVHHSFALNCRSVHAIPPHGHVEYAMQLSVPRQAKPGNVKFSWNLDTPTGPLAGEAVEVTAG
jgi:hypothetical protein